MDPFARVWMRDRGTEYIISQQVASLFYHQTETDSVDSVFGKYALCIFPLNHSPYLIKSICLNIKGTALSINFRLVNAVSVWLVASRVSYQACHPG